jgi:hypothetical protein
MFQQPIAQTVKGTVQGATNAVSGFASNAISNSRSFLSSNSIIARISFVILVIIAYLLLFKLGIWIIAWIMTPKKNPYLVSGMIPGSTSLVFAQDSASANSVPISRSNDQSTGLEFTWSVWVNLTGVPVSGKYFHIFHKGDSSIPADPTATTSPVTNNGPGLYVANDGVAANLVVIMNSNDTSKPIYTVNVDNIPMKKWVHVIIRMENTIMDVYINGTLAKRTIFQNTMPRQNYGKVYVCQPMGGNSGSGASGFNGYLSDLRYYDHSLSVFSINNITYLGPNLRTSSLLSSMNPNYGNSYFFDRVWYGVRY